MNAKICRNCKFYKKSTRYCSYLEEEASFRETCAGFEFRKSIDWEQRRYEIAKDMLVVLYADITDTPENRVEASIHYADVLIEKLKRYTNE